MTFISGIETERCSKAASLRRGFTLSEVMIALAISGLIFGVVISGYVMAADQAEWSAFSLSAQSLATESVEQVRASRWDAQAYPPLDELGLTNFTEINTMDVGANGKVVYATNFVSVTIVSTNPLVREIRSDCVWLLEGRRRGNRGPFTNTAVCLRASDQ